MLEIKLDIPSVEPEVPQFTPIPLYAADGGIGVTRLQLLEEVLSTNPGKFDNEVIERVRQLVEFEAMRPGNRPFRIFKDSKDYLLYFQLHPEWQGRTPIAMKNDTQFGGNAFYIAFRRYTKRLSIGEEERRELTQRVFQPGRYRWDLLVNLEDWIEFYNQHPEWQGKSAAEIREAVESDASAFHRAFTKWLAIVTSDRRERRRLMYQIFEQKKPRTKWNYLETIEDWIEEHEKYPDLQGKSPKEMADDIDSEASAFYQAFVKWTQRVTTNRSIRRDLVRKIFQSSVNDWSGYGSLQDWMEEFNKHPEWQGKQQHTIAHDSEFGGSRFYAAFISWVKRTTRTDEERRIYIKSLFPESKLRNINTNMISPESANRQLRVLIEETQIDTMGSIN